MESTLLLTILAEERDSFSPDSLAGGCFWCDKWLTKVVSLTQKGWRLGSFLLRHFLRHLASPVLESREVNGLLSGRLVDQMQMLKTEVEP